jgi:hypothetical protein
MAGCFPFPVDRKRHQSVTAGSAVMKRAPADKVMRTPLSKQRNKHIQRVPLEAAKLAPKQDHDLALVYEGAPFVGGHAQR